MLTDLEEIKNRLDIADIIQQYLRLDKAGANWKARCPFHNEKTPSFMVSSDKQIWHCFGCGEGGDIFGFVMKIEGVEFKEALRTLAEKAGVKLQYSKEYAETKDTRDTLYEINEWAAKFYEKQLWADTQTSGKVLDYLSKRGLKKETIKNFRLGYAPKDWHGLGQFLNNKGYKDSDSKNAGLIVESRILGQGSKVNEFQVSSFKFHDRFRGRIMFPITDIQGRVTGFTGRVFEPLFTKEELENQGKYVNSPETAVYNKSNILYGLDKAKVSLRKNNLCVLVEGNMDLIMSHQAGIDNVVAVSGTALTDKQAQIIKRYAENIAIAFDSDEAGNIATKRSVDLAMSGGLNVKIINIRAEIQSPQIRGDWISAKDPADILKEKNGVNLWRNMINKALGVLDFYFNDTFLKFKPNSAENKREIAKILLPVIKKIQNKVEQHHWLHILADKISIKEEFLIEALNSIKARIDSRRPPSAAFRSQGDDDTGNRDQLGENLLGLIVKYYEEGYNDIILPEDLFFTNERINMIYKSFIDTIKRKKKVKDFYNVLINEDRNFVNKLMFIVEERWSVSDGGGLDFLSIKNDINLLLESLRLRKIKQDLNNLASDIKQAEKESDKTALGLLKEEFGKLANKLQYHEKN